MADHHDLRTRTAADDIVDDDPLAELARIIGYERPQPARAENSRAEIAAPQTVPDADVFDLEAELMRELDMSGEAVEPEPVAVAAASAPEAEPALEAVTTPESGPAATYETTAATDETTGETDASWASLDADAVSEMTPDVAGSDDETLAASAADFVDLVVEDLLDDELAIDEELSLDVDYSNPAAGGELPAGAASAPHAAPYRSYEEPLAPVSQPDEVDVPVEEPATEVETDIFDALIDWPEDEWKASVEAVEPEAQHAEPAMAASETTAAAAPAAASQSARNPDQDDILADISRFELPSHGQPEPHTPAVVAPPAATFVAEAPVTVAPHALHLGVSATGSAADYRDEPALDIEPDYESSVEPAPAEVRASEPEPGKPMMTMPDFEDELSAELDIYRHEIEITAVAEDEAADEIIADADGNAYFGEAPQAFPSGGEGADGQSGEVDFDAELGSALATAFDDMPAATEDIRAADGRHDGQAHGADSAVDLGVSHVPVPTAPRSSAPENDEMTAAFLDLAPAAGEMPAHSDEPAWPEDFTFAEDVPDLDAAAGHDDPASAVHLSHAEAGDEAALDDADWLDVMEHPEPPRSVDARSAPGLSVVPPVAAATMATVAATASYSGHGIGRLAEQPAPRDMGADAFDLSAISETRTGLDVVRPFDVPAVPNAAEPDLVAGSAFEDDIEREFADLVEQETRDLHVPAAVDWQSRSGEEARPAGRDFDHLEDALEADLGAQVEPTEVAYRPRPVPVDADQALKAAQDQRPREESKRGPAIAGAVLGAAVLFGGIAFGWSYLSGGTDAPDGGPRIIRADKEPVKIVPENPGGLSVPNQDKAVYDRVAGTDAAGSTQPKLVTTAEEPVDVVQRTLDPDVLPLEGRDDGDTGTKAEERLTEAAAGDAASAGSAAPAEPIVSPRKVRTMIVRPDGTIVAREEPVTEPATPANEAAAVPAQAPAETSPTPLAPATDVAGPAAGTSPAELRPAIEAAATQEAPAAPAAEDAPLAPVRVVKTTQITPDGANAPVPTARPADQPVTVVSTVTETGRVTDGAAPANPGGYFVQIASQPSPEGAQASYQNLSNRYASIIGGRGVDIQRADIPGKGVFHRVRIPAGDRAAANALCAQYKAAGGSCIVTR